MNAETLKEIRETLNQNYCPSFSNGDYPIIDGWAYCAISQGEAFAVDVDLPDGKPTGPKSKITFEDLPGINKNKPHYSGTFTVTFLVLRHDSDKEIVLPESVSVVIFCEENIHHLYSFESNKYLSFIHGNLVSQEGRLLHHKTSKEEIVWNTGMHSGPVLAENIHSIASNTFGTWFHWDKLKISKSLTSIEDKAFNGCEIEEMDFVDGISGVLLEQMECQVIRELSKIRINETEQAEKNYLGLGCRRKGEDLILKMPKLRYKPSTDGMIQVTRLIGDKLIELSAKDIDISKIHDYRIETYDKTIVGSRIDLSKFVDNTYVEKSEIVYDSKEDIKRKIIDAIYPISSIR